MRRLIGWAAYLYPASWRARYGREFDALLDDANVCWRDVADVLREGFIMRIMSWKIYGRAAAAMGLACAVLALAGSFLIPNTYQSTAVLRVSAPSVDRVFQEFEQTESMILGRRSLQSMILDPRLDLYKEERKHLPADEVAAQMRTRDLHVRLYGLQGTSPVGERAFQISFNYSDRYKAQEVVKELTARFEQLNFELIRQQGMEGKSKIELVSAATLPEIPISPNHMAFVWMGLGGGMLVGLLVALVWRQPKATLRMAGFAAAGAALAIGVGYFIPNVYMSRAVMRVAGTEDFATASGRLNEISEQVLSRGNLASLIQLPQLDLYEKERAHVPLTEIVEKMRSKDLRIQLRQAPESGGAPPFEIGFSYSDRFKAQQAVRELSGQFIRWGMMHNEGYHIEILDNADLPETPAFPNRTNIAILGACAGLLLGIIRQSFFTGGSLRSELPVEPAPDPA